MEWILVALIGGALIYAGKITIEWANYTLQSQPRMASLAEREERAESATSEEDARLATVREGIEGVKARVSELNHQIAAINGALQAENRRKQRLEMEVFKQRLKSGKPIVMA